MTTVVDDTIAPNHFTIDALTVGQSVREVVRFTAEAMDGFVRLSADNAPFHVSRDAAKAGGFDGPIIHGMHLAMRFSRLLGLYLPGGATVIQKVNLNFLDPVYLDDEVTFSVTVERIIEAVDCVVLALLATRGERRVVDGRAQCIFRLRPGPR